MSTIVLDDNRRKLDGEWGRPARAYECRIWLHPEQEGGYSVTSPVLPGMVTEGESIQECVDNAREALEGLIAEYAAGGREIPWQKDNQEIPRGVTEKRILVHA